MLQLYFLGYMGAIYHLHMSMLRNLGALTSCNSVGLFRPVTGHLYLYLCAI